jgi:hypothetical protein
VPASPSLPSTHLCRRAFAGTAAFLCEPTHCRDFPSCCPPPHHHHTPSPCRAPPPRAPAPCCPTSFMTAPSGRGCVWRAASTAPPLSWSARPTAGERAASRWGRGRGGGGRARLLLIAVILSTPLPPTTTATTDLQTPSPRRSSTVTFELDGEDLTTQASLYSPPQGPTSLPTPAAASGCPAGRHSLPSCPTRHALPRCTFAPPPPFEEAAINTAPVRPHSSRRTG